MKTKSNFRFNRIAPLTLATLLVPALSAQAQTPLSSGHVDVGIAFAGNAWDLHVHDGENNVEYEPNDALLVVTPLAMTLVPAGAQWNFLGNAGDTIWQLPKSEIEGVVFLGLGTEEIASGLFVGNQINLTLTGWSGPGNFALFDVDEFGDLSNLWMSTQDGLSGADNVSLATGGHAHYLWAFTAPGDYTLTFTAGGTLVEDSLATSSGPVNYQFQVQPVPEPGAATLLGLGGLTMLFLRRPRSA